MEMRKPGCQLFLCFSVMAALVLSGCEWQGAGSKDTWSDSVTGWLNFSGVYINANSNAVSASGNVSAPVTQVIGTQSNGVFTYSATLQNTPVVPGSVTVTTPFGLEIFQDDSNGNMIGSMGGTGTINYNTGDITLHYAWIVIGDPMTVQYKYSGAGIQSPATTTAGIIFTVQQTGNQLTLIDSGGNTYSGQIISMTPDPSSISNLTVTVMVTANFQVSGTDPNGSAVTIVGAFTGDYNGPKVGGNGGIGGDGTLGNRIIQGTIVDADGQNSPFAGYTFGVTYVTTTAGSVTYGNHQ